MRICHLLQQKRPVFSFEFFPPKTPQGEAALFRTIEALRPLAPGFVSVTYGAGGSTREKTLDWVARIKHELGIEAMAHLTCVGSNRDEMRAMLQRIDDLGIENVLALRGDPPRDQPGFQPVPDGFAHASDLVRFIRTEGFSFCLGGAAYPEGHIEAPDLETDLTYLGEKVAAGVDFLITQLFFDNRFFFDFVERARSRGIHVPIIPGIMPITNVAQIERFTRLCGASIPPALQARLDAVRHNEDAVRCIGIEHAAAQCRDLLAHGVPGIHFYTLNQSPATRAIVEQLQRGPVACPAS
jgi:methylenetetrahydrofolate reductase (NADPH)